MYLKPIILFAAIFLIFTVSASKSFTIYTWKDTNGVTHFSYVMPENHKYTTIEMKKHIQKNIISEDTDTDNQNNDLDKKINKQNQENCKAAQHNLTILSQFENVKLTNEHGEEKILSEQDKQDQIVQEKKRIELFCK